MRSKFQVEEVKGVDSRCGRADVGELPFEILLQRLKALEGDLELVRRVELRGVVLHLNAEKRDDRHFVVSISRSV